MKKLNNKGFGIIEGLLILVMVGLIGGIGYYVYRQNQKPSSEYYDLVEQDKETARTAAIEGTENWKTETNSEFGFSYKYPSNNNCKTFYIATKKDSQEYQDGERINNSGVLCTPKNAHMPQGPFDLRVAAVGSNSDYGDAYGEDALLGNNFYKLTSTEKVEKNGKSGTKWVYSPADDSSDAIIYYAFTSGDYYYTFVINGTGNKLKGVKGTELGERIFATFQFAN